MSDPARRVLVFHDQMIALHASISIPIGIDFCDGNHIAVTESRYRLPAGQYLRFRDVDRQIDGHATPNRLRCIPLPKSMLDILDAEFVSELLRLEGEQAKSAIRPVGGRAADCGSTNNKHLPVAEGMPHLIGMVLMSSQGDIEVEL